MFKIKKEQQECESSPGQKSLYPNPVKQENQYVWSSQAAQCLEELETVPVPVEAESQEEEQHSSPYILNVTNSLHCALKGVYVYVILCAITDVFKALTQIHSH